MEFEPFEDGKHPHPFPLAEAGARGKSKQGSGLRCAPPTTAMSAAAIGDSHDPQSGQASRQGKHFLEATCGIALLCGIGFTMSLFIGGLAFPGRPELFEEAKVGILPGSFLSAIAGFLVLRFAPPLPKHAAASAAVEGEIDTHGDAVSGET